MRPPAAAASGVPADLQAAAKNVPWESGLRASSAAVAFPRSPSRPRARFSLFPDRVASPLGSGSSQPGGAVVRWPGLPGVAVHYALAGATCQVEHAMAWRMRHVSAAARSSTSARQLAPPATASETARLAGPVSHRDTLFAVVRAATLRSAVTAVRDFAVTLPFFLGYVIVTLLWDGSSLLSGYLGRHRPAMVRVQTGGAFLPLCWGDGVHPESACWLWSLALVLVRFSLGLALRGAVIAAYAIYWLVPGRLSRCGRRRE